MKRCLTDKMPNEKAKNLKSIQNKINKNCKKDLNFFVFLRILKTANRIGIYI